jgi:hypothetical protein
LRTKAKKVSLAIWDHRFANQLTPDDGTSQTTLVARSFSTLLPALELSGTQADTVFRHLKQTASHPFHRHGNPQRWHISCPPHLPLAAAVEIQLVRESCARCLVVLTQAYTFVFTAAVLDVEVSFTEQWRNNGNLFLRARDCDLTSLIGGDPDEPIMKTTCAFVHALSDPSDYGHLSALIPDDGTGIQFTRPILSGSLSKASVIDEIYKGMRVPSEIKAAHKLAVNRAGKESSREGIHGRIPIYTTFYRFPEDFRGSNQYFADGNAAKGELRSIPIHKDIFGKFGVRKGEMNDNEDIEIAPIFAVAFLFVEKDFADEGEEPSSAPRDLMKDLESTFKNKNKI